MAVEIGSSADLMLGETVIALGNPFYRSYCNDRGNPQPLIVHLKQSDAFIKTLFRPMPASTQGTQVVHWSI